MCTVYMLLHLHKLHEAHKADIELFAFASWCMHLVYALFSAIRQHSLLWGYSHLQNAQAVHQHHTRHVAIYLHLHHT